MEPIYLAAGASFVMGASGYVIVQFWIRPIRRYRALKRRVASELARGGKKDRARTLRRLSVSLSDAYSHDLPHWYRMVLDSRGESPVEASRTLMRLSNTRDPKQIRERREEIRRALQR